MEQLTTAELERLKRLLVAPQSMAYVRQQLLSEDELDFFRKSFEGSSPVRVKRGDEEFECEVFEDFFDMMGRKYLPAIAMRRNTTKDELCLQLSYEMGLINEPYFRRLQRTLTGSINPSISGELRYDRHSGELFLDNELIGSLQTRKSPSKLERVLIEFEERRWPRQIAWDPDETKYVTRKLREKFAPRLRFRECDGGSGIRIELTDPPQV